MTKAADAIWEYLDRQPGVTQVAHARPIKRLVRQIKLEGVRLADDAGRGAVE